MAEQVSGAGIRVSLIPTAAERTADVSVGVRIVAIATVAAVALSALAYGGAYWYVSGKKRQVAELDARAKAAADGMLALRERLAEARTEAKRLKNIRTLLDEHLVWTEFFGFLEKNTHKDIAFTQFSTQGLDTVTMQAEALDYRAIAEQVQALSSAPGVTEVKAGGISALVAPTGQITAVKLTLTLKFSPEMIRLTRAKSAAAD